MRKDSLYQEEEKKAYGPSLIIAVILIVIISAGLIAFVFWLINQDFSDQQKREDKVTNSLLRLLNDNITKTKVGDEKLADEITTFSYSDKHFYIAGASETTIYQYDMNLDGESLAGTKEALDFIINNEVIGKYEVSLTRWTPVESNDFTTKYVTDGVKGKYHIGQFESNTLVFATLLNDEQITIINGDILDDVLLNSYKPTIIKKDNSLYSDYLSLVNQ